MFLDTRKNWFWHFKWYNLRWGGKFIDNGTAYLLHHYKRPILRVDIDIKERKPFKASPIGIIFTPSDLRGMRCCLNAFGLKELGK